MTEGERRMTELLPFLRAARIGLQRSRWRPGWDTDDLLAPIVLAVLVEVSRQLGPFVAVVVRGGQERSDEKGAAS